MKNILVLFLSLIFYDGYSQKETQSFCEGSPDGKYFSFDIEKKKVFWNDSYYFETKQGVKEFEGKLYTEFRQEFKEGKVHLLYFREENGVIYEYSVKCSKEYVKLDTKTIGQQWETDCGEVSYKVIDLGGKLKTPYCHYKNLLVIEATYKSGKVLFYYQKGYGFVGGTNKGKLFSCAVPEWKNHFEQNPFTQKKPLDEQNLFTGQKPFSSENAHNTFAVKGIAYLNFLDGGYGGILGVEKGFSRNHSIGIKYSYDLATPHEENTADGSYDPINYSHNKNRSFILEYKYYFDFRLLAKSYWSPYVSLSFKSGTKTFENDRDYPHDFYYREMKYNLLGPGIGAIFFDHSGRWSADTQISYLLGKKNVTTEGVPNSTSSQMDKLRFELLVAYNINW